MKKIKVQYLLIAICIVIIISIGIWKITSLKKDIQVSEDTRWKIKKVYADKNNNEWIPGIAIVPKWEEMTITQKFNNVEFNGKTYEARHSKINEQMIANKLGIAVLKGQDIYTNTTYNKNAEIYQIKDFPNECAIAVKFENDSDYYPYINAYYKPTTLGAFLEDLNLKQIVEFGSVWYDASYKDEQGKLDYEEIEFPDVTDDDVWEMLFEDETLQNVHRDNDYHDRIMSISVNIPLFGYKNISVSVSKDGYLTTNIFETGKTFYIGKEKVENFVNYILENYDGYKTIYVDENGDEITDNGLEESKNSNAKEEIIMTYTNSTKQTQIYEEVKRANQEAQNKVLSSNEISEDEKKQMKKEINDIEQKIKESMKN